MVSNSNRKGPIAPGHKGPCAVYLKRVENMQNTSSAAGPGWFKIWEDGYDTTSGKWCVDRLIEKKGLLSVKMPPGLPEGYYLVRPEILALHNAVDGDAQFYLGCAQIYIQQGPEQKLDIPKEYGASIPGYVSADTPGVKFNIYQKPISEYTVPGPRVYIPQGNGTSSQTSQANQIQDGVPSDCILKNANWCAKAVPRFSTEDGCWASVKNCYAQSQVCWDTAPPSGDVNCKTWQEYCKTLEAECDSGKGTGPVEFKGKEVMALLPGEIPVPWNDVFEGKDSGKKKDGVSEVITSSTASITTGAKETQASEYSGRRRGVGRRHGHKHFGH